MKTESVGWNIKGHICEESLNLRQQRDALLEAARGQHEAIDWLMARLAEKDENFMPSESFAWSRLVKGNIAIKACEEGK